MYMVTCLPDDHGIEGNRGFRLLLHDQFERVATGIELTGIIPALSVFDYGRFFIDRTDQRIVHIYVHAAITRFANV